MWFRSVFLKTLRECRVAILGWGLGMGLLMIEIQAAFSSLVGNAAVTSTIASLTASMTWAGDPVALDTVGGYATWKNGLSIVLTAIWALIAGSRILRGAEERGSMDVLLTQPRGRLRVAVESLLAVLVAIFAQGLLVGLLTFAGGASAHADYGLGGALLFGLNLSLVCSVFAGIAVLVSQFTQERRGATGITGGLLFLFIMLDMLHRVVPGTDWISRLSPVYYYNLSKPLVTSVGANVGGMVALAAITLVLSAVGMALFLVRDIGRTAIPARRAEPGPGRTMRARLLPADAWSLRSVYARGVAMLAAPAIWWTIGIAAFAGFGVLIVKQTEDALATITAGSAFFSDLMTKLGGADPGTNGALLGALFILLPVLSMAFAVTQASRWASDEDEGRHELVLATPQPRLRVLLGRFGALATAAAFMAVVTLAVTELAASASGLTLGAGNVAAATLSIIPQCLLMAALGYLGAGWLRSALESGLLSFLLVIWFFISFIGPEIGFSGTVLKLSAFYYYGTPLAHGLPLGDMLIVVAVGAVALGIASVRFVRKDIGRS
jgi:ABC-2 type transport system permease protein